MTLRHVVAWTLATNDSDEKEAHAAGVRSRLEGLHGVVPSILTIKVGVNELFPEANYDVVVIADFEDAAGLEAYLVHPAHLEAASWIKTVVAARAAVDFTV